MEAVIQERSTNWLTGNFDAATKDAIKKMQAKIQMSWPIHFIAILNLERVVCVV